MCHNGVYPYSLQTQLSILLRSDSLLRCSVKILLHRLHYLCGCIPSLICDVQFPLQPVLPAYIFQASTFYNTFNVFTSCR